MNTLGRHVIAEFYGCDADLLDLQEPIEAHMRAAALAIGATVVATAFHKFAPQGVSGTVVISESHLSIHTWPEAGYVAVDIYTCSGLDPHPGIDYLGRALGARDRRVQEIARGLPEDTDEPSTGRRWTPEDVEIITRDVAVTAIPPAG